MEHKDHLAGGSHSRVSGSVDPLVGARAYTYLSGDVTPIGTYVDGDRLPAQANPTVLPKPSQALDNIKTDDALAAYVDDFVGAAILAERERCAQVCERMAKRHEDIRRAALEVAAESIRSHE